MNITACSIGVTKLSFLIVSICSKVAQQTNSCCQSQTRIAAKQTETKFGSPTSLRTIQLKPKFTNNIIKTLAHTCVISGCCSN